MFVCRLTSCLSTDEITDRDIETQMTTGTPGHREYKWRPGHSKRKRPGHKECFERPHQLGVGVTQQLVYIYINKLSVCLSSDVMFVCRLTSCSSTDEITDRDIETQMTTGTPGNREYKWRPGHSKRKRPGHKECLISNHHQQSTGTQMMTGTQGM